MYGIVSCDCFALICQKFFVRQKTALITFNNIKISLKSKI